ncbi:LysM peptidoglycan-binding domain-containing protein [Tuanshanicoccus lijuaniae]|uniref:aggregation-promoting factor C-terminal-like domain-containing protein n=1 Tax=Aerococcaceae bacterium zg-1292 TaxID=2774330 RepID=UPI001934E787|nr:LysM peptidoglycan-binding domain-containing protein [Aerococcaceae bacterium zg-1292]QQA36954.1 LysM peptidoglycan-binding domain-containing protein [Aerococcaceae bacterium zg-1292]
MMKKTLKIMATTAILSLATFNLNTALAQTWTQRSESEVRESLKTNESGVYVIQWGDTLSTIAAATGYTVEELASINAIADANFIQAGSVLYFNHKTNTLSYVNPSSEQPQTYTVAPTSGYAVPETAEWVSAQKPAETTEAAETVAEETTAPVEETQAPVAEETTVAPATTQAPAVEETTVAPATTQAPAAEETTVAPAAIQAPAAEETTAAPTTTQAPVVEETTQAPAPTTSAAPEAPAEESEEAPAPEVEEPTTQAAPAASNSGLNQYGGIISEAKEWIAMKESGGNYEIWNPTGKFYGRYQLTASYLNGDLSRENQEKVADQYVLNRYGSWEAAKTFWEANGWY